MQEFGTGFPRGFGRRLPEGRWETKRATGWGEPFNQCPTLRAGSSAISAGEQRDRARSFYRDHFAVAKTCGKSWGEAVGEEVLRGDPALKEEGCPPSEQFLPGLPSFSSTPTLQPPPTGTDRTAKLF